MGLGTIGDEGIREVALDMSLSEVQVWVDMAARWGLNLPCNDDDQQGLPAELVRIIVATASLLIEHLPLHEHAEIAVALLVEASSSHRVQLSLLSRCLRLEQWYTLAIHKNESERLSNCTPRCSIYPKPET